MYAFFFKGINVDWSIGRLFFVSVRRLFFVSCHIVIIIKNKEQLIEVWCDGTIP